MVPKNVEFHIVSAFQNLWRKNTQYFTLGKKLKDYHPADTDLQFPVPWEQTVHCVENAFLKQAVPFKIRTFYHVRLYYFHGTVADSTAEVTPDYVKSQPHLIDYKSVVIFIVYL